MVRPELFLRYFKASPVKRLGFCVLALDEMNFRGFDQVLTDPNVIRPQHLFQILLHAHIQQFSRRKVTVRSISLHPIAQAFGGLGMIRLQRLYRYVHPADAERHGFLVSALAMNIVERVSVIDQVPTAVFSLEMGAEELTLRLVCSMAGVSMERAENGGLTETDLRSLTAANGRINKAPLHIIDQGGLTIARLAG